MRKEVFGLALGLALVTATPEFVESQERIIPEQLQRTYDLYHYAPAVRVGNMLYLSGSVGASPNGPNDIQTQSRRAFQWIEFVLSEAGAEMSDIVELVTYHVNMGETVQGFMEVKDQFLMAPYPTWTAIGVDRLFLEQALVEIKVTAVVDGD